jgi:DnaJ-class molecular chaperone
VTPDPRHEQPEPEPEPDEGDGEDEGAEVAAAAPTDSPADEAGEADGATDLHSVACPFCDGSGELEYAPRQATGWMRCPDCDGWGSVYTGSRLNEAGLIDCERCSGKGYAPRPQAVPEYVEPGSPGAYYDANTGTWKRAEHTPAQASGY